MTDIAHNPAGLDQVAQRFKDLAEDSKAITTYWSNEGLTRANAAGGGLPGKALPELHSLTPGIQGQADALKAHIMTVNKALLESAEMFRDNEAANIDKIKQIWSEVPQGDSQSGYSGNPETGLPSQDVLNKPPEGYGPGAWKLALEISQLGRNIQAETIVISWLDGLLGGLFGKSPVEKMIEFFTGDWKAIGEVAAIFGLYAKYDGRMEVMMKRGSKETRSLGEWEGPSQRIAQDSINGNADRLDGQRKIWYGARDKFEGWESASYVLMAEIKSLLADAAELIFEAKKLFSKANQLRILIADNLLEAALHWDDLLAILKQAFEIAVSVLTIFVKVVEKMFYILQAFVVGMAVVTALIGGDADLEREW